MKFLLVTILTLLTSCSFFSSSQGNKVTPNTVQKKLQLNVPKDIWEPIFFEAIDERANRGRLRSLRLGALPGDDLEVRVWHGFGLTALQGFVLKRTGGQWSAVHLSGIVRNAPLQESQQTLQPPKSGWDRCWKRLQAAGILSLPDAVAIGCSAMINDGMSYVVEYNSDGVYRTYMYDNPVYAKCGEAKRMIVIGNTIAEEFNVPVMATK